MIYVSDNKISKLKDVKISLEGDRDAYNRLAESSFRGGDFDKSLSHYVDSYNIDSSQDEVKNKITILHFIMRNEVVAFA